MVKTSISRQATGKSSQVQVGSTPQARMKMKTTIRLRASWKSAVSTDREGDHQARELGLADDPLLRRHRGDRVGVASWKKVKRTMSSSSTTG